MPGPVSDPDNPLALIASSSQEIQRPSVYPIHHRLSPPISRLSISWSRGNCLRVSVFRQQPPSRSSTTITTTDNDDGEVGGRVVELKLSNGSSEIDDATWRRIAYGSVSPFAMLQNRKNSAFALSKVPVASLSNVEWWVYVMEYSKEINSLLGNSKSSPSSVIDDPRTIVKVVEEPTCLKAAWELLEIFYADKQSQAWLPERLVDWLADYDSLFSQTQTTVHSRLVDLQNDLVYLQVIEDDPKYWEMISSALSVGWLDIVVKLLRLHGSYQLDQIGSREIENGLVEAVAVLVSKMPRLRPELVGGRLGECSKNKPDFNMAREKWRAQLTKLDCSGYWVQCGHQQTKEGLRKLLQIMLGNIDSLSASTCHWMELYIAQLLYTRPFTVGLESMYSLAQKCMRLKPVSHLHSLMRLVVGILEENTEVVLAECSKAFGPWMVAHMIELLTAGSDQSETLLLEEHDSLGGISIQELHRIVYAQVLASHTLTWQLAPIYLISCTKQGMGLLEILLHRQPVQHNQGLLKNLEFCRLYELINVSSSIMKIAGICHWKHGRKGSGIFWLQQAQDEFRLNKIAQKLFDFVGKSVSSASFKQWEGLVELLGSDTETAGGLEFLHKYRDFKKSLQQVNDGKANDAARQAVESLIKLMKNPSTPQRFWLPLLYDSLKLLTWPEAPLLNVTQTNLLLNKLQELSMAKLRPDYVEADLPPQALSSVRLALATNLGRAILEE
ncbi:Nucleoporin nup85 [Ancistrocladus abbreviatus]